MEILTVIIQFNVPLKLEKTMSVIWRLSFNISDNLLFLGFMKPSLGI
jgi:hypothetical protein